MCHPHERRRRQFARLRRLPAFWASCSITFALTLAMGGSRFRASLSQYPVNMSMLSEFVDVPSLDGAYWSLFVEMRFYALVGIVLLIGRIHQVPAVLFFWLVASAVLEARPSYLLSYIFITDYSAYFIAGATCFLIWSRGMSAAKMGMIALSWALVLLQAINGLPGSRNTTTRA
jgi:peptidoglycan/LPS O-acetylase OafA/YrhL